MNTALSIAGSDCSGGAGIQADLKTMTMHRVYAMSVITALTAQNTMGVRAVMEVTPEFLQEQLNAVFDDIPPQAVKIGMVSSAALIRVIAQTLRERKQSHVVVDPVMVATSGSKLLADEAVETLQKELFPLAEVVTPNIPEAQVLSGIAIQTKQDMERAARMISRDFGCAVLLKGGHRVEEASDVLVQKGECTWFVGERIANPNTHGTGCTLSSAIAANLAKGQDLVHAVRCAKEYLTDALAAMLDLGQGSGPLNHAFGLTKKA